MVVGNEPVIGMWNPSKAIPMKWSQGNIWTVELVSTLSIQFSTALLWVVLHIIRLDLTCTGISSLLRVNSIKRKI